MHFFSPFFSLLRSYNEFSFKSLAFLKEEEEKEEEEQAKLKESVSKQPDVALEEMTVPTTREAREQARAKTLDKQGQLCELSRALAVLASASVSIMSNCFS